VDPIVLVTPAGITTRPDSSLLVAEGGANRIARIDLSNGRVTSYAGSGGSGTSGDGGPAAQANIGNPYGIAVSRDGDVYVTSDQRVRRIDSNGRISTLFQAEDMGPVTVDAQGNVFFSTSTWVYRFDAATGRVDTYAGTGVKGSAGDGGPALAAQVNRPHGLLISASDGALLIADTDNHRIRRVDPVTRIITTVSAAFDGPAGLCHGPNGVLYVTDFLRQTVDRLDPAGPVRLVGTGTKSSSGDGGPAPQATIDTPLSCAVDGNTGKLFIVEAGGSGTIRVVGPDGKISTLSRRRA
jgi:streptogramin lyase